MRQKHKSTKDRTSFGKFITFGECRGCGQWYVLDDNGNLMKHQGEEKLLCVGIHFHPNNIKILSSTLE